MRAVLKLLSTVILFFVVMLGSAYFIENYFSGAPTGFVPLLGFMIALPLTYVIWRRRSEY